MEITPDLYIEELIETYPQAVSYLMEKGIRCLLCGEPIWGTLSEAMKEKGYSYEKQMQLVGGLRNFISVTESKKEKKSL